MPLHRSATDNSQTSADESPAVTTDSRATTTKPSCVSATSRSAKHIDHVRRYSTASGNTLVVQMALADHANQELQCWPGHQRLAREARCGESTVKRAINWLKEHEGLVVVSNGGPPNDVSEPTNLYIMPEHWFAPATEAASTPDIRAGQTEPEREWVSVPVDITDEKAANRRESSSTGLSRSSPLRFRMTDRLTDRLEAVPTEVERVPATNPCLNCGKDVAAPQTTCSQACSFEMCTGKPYPARSDEELEKERLLRQLSAGQERADR